LRVAIDFLLQVFGLQIPSQLLLKYQNFQVHYSLSPCHWVSDVFEIPCALHLAEQKGRVEQLFDSWDLSEIAYKINQPNALLQNYYFQNKEKNYSNRSQYHIFLHRCDPMQHQEYQVLDELLKLL
jgi:hypothetical protein